MGQRVLGCQKQHAAAGRAEQPLLRELCHSIVARSADYARGNAAEDFRSCSRRPPPEASHGRAPSSDAHRTAAHLARRSCIADHLVGILRAPRLLGSDAVAQHWGLEALIPDRIDPVPRPQARSDRARSDRLSDGRAQVPRFGRGEAYFPPRSALSRARARTLRARV